MVQPLKLNYEMYHDMFPEDDFDYLGLFKNDPDRLTLPTPYHGVHVLNPDYDAAYNRHIAKIFNSMEILISGLPS